MSATFLRIFIQRTVSSTIQMLLPGQTHLIFSAIADNFILRAHNQSMTNNQSRGLLLKADG
jgi:hypothetical protein